MKRAFAPLLLCTLTLPAVAAESSRLTPLPLEAAQMDSITAGAMTVSASASTSLNGTTSYVSTYADASVKNTGGGVVQIGRATGEVITCCGIDAQAGFSFSGTSDGTMVKEHTHVGNPHYRNGMYVATAKYQLISITPPNR